MKTIFCYFLAALPLFGFSQNISKADWILKTDVLASTRGHQSLNLSIEKKIPPNQSIEIGANYIFDYLFQIPIGAHPVAHHLNDQKLNFNINLGWKHYFYALVRRNKTTFLYHQFQFQVLHFQHFDTSCERVLTNNLFMNTLFANGDCVPDTYQVEVFETNNQRWSILLGIGKMYRYQHWTIEGILALSYFQNQIVHPELKQTLDITPIIQQRIDQRIIDGSSVYSSFFSHGDPLKQQNGWGMQIQLKVGYILE